MNGSGSSRRKMVRANVLCDAYVTYAFTAQSLRRMAPTRSCRSRVTRRTREEDPSVGLSAEVSKPETDADADADDDAGEGKVRTRRNLRMTLMPHGRSSTSCVRYAKSVGTATT